MCTRLKRSSSRRHYSFRRPNILAHARPTVLLADPIDGLIKTIDLTRPLDVTVPAWEGASENDSYQLTINGSPIGTALEIPQTPPAPGTPMPIAISQTDINTHLATDGRYEIGYQTVTFPGGTPSPSEPHTIEVDRTPPGQHQLGQMTFPDEVKDGLTAEELSDLGDVLPCGIVGYSGLKRGDTIQVYWGNNELLPPIVLSGNEDESKPIPVTFTKAFLLAQGQAEQVYYKITDRAENTSQDSIKTTVLLFLTEPVRNLPAPIIEGHVDPLTYADAKDGVEVQIPTSAFIEVGDQITLHWGTETKGPYPIHPNDIGLPIILKIDVDFDTIQAARDGAIRLTYDVIRAPSPAPVGYSQPLDIIVYTTRPVPGDLAKPTVRGLSSNAEDNFINENDFELDATVIIPWNTGFKAGYLIDAFWGGVQVLAQPYVILPADVVAERALSLTALNSKFKPVGTGTDIRVWYNVVETGNPNIQLSLEQSIIVRSKEELPGGPDGPDAPEFTDLNDAGSINPINGLNGAPVHIKPYLNIKEGDVIHFLYEGFDSLEGGNKKNEWAFTSLPLTAQQAIDGYDLRVPRADLYQTCYGHAEITFRVESITGAGNSKRGRAYVDMRTGGSCL